MFYKGGPVSVGDSGAVDLQWLDLVLQCCMCLILRGVGCMVAVDSCDVWRGKVIMTVCTTPVTSRGSDCIALIGGAAR